MKVGDIVRCINHGSGTHLTFGKYYKIVWVDSRKTYNNNTVKVISDHGGINIFFAFRFKKMNREEKLKRILK